MELAYAGLQQLCAPLLDHLDELPEPQRDALNVAFGRGVGPTPDRFLVGLAVLSLIAAAADARPLLCVIDDAQWLDQVSVQTLGFVARRLMAEPVAMVFAVRDSPDVLAGLPELTIDGLSDSDARALLESVMVGGIDPRVRDRIVAETRGIPLALLEVPRNVPATELAGGFWISGTDSSAGAIEEKYVERIKALPADTQRLLLVAAAEPVGDAALFLRAAARLGIAVDALGPAESAGIIEFGPRMRFRHPLMRSAAYRAADLAERRAIHRALAEATDPETDPDRRAWHAANAAAGPDDAVAAELEASAGRAQSRGGVAAAATFLERAVALTADPEQRGARALAAAQAKRDAAAPAAAHELLTIAEMSPLSELQRAQVARLRAQMEFVRSRAGDAGAPRLSETVLGLLEAARRLEGLDDYASRESYLEALAAVMYAGRLGEPARCPTWRPRRKVALGEERELPRAVDYLLKGIAERITGGVGRGRPVAARRVGPMREHAQSGDSSVGRWLTVPAFPILQESAAHELWDEEIVAELSTAAVRRARDAGALAGLPRALVYRAGAHLLAGEFATAATLIEEADSIAAATDHYGPVRYHTLLLTAWRGDPAQAVPLIEAAAADATSDRRRATARPHRICDRRAPQRTRQIQRSARRRARGMRVRGLRVLQLVSVRTGRSRHAQRRQESRGAGSAASRGARRRRAEPIGAGAPWRVRGPCSPTTTTPMRFSPRPSNAWAHPRRGAFRPRPVVLRRVAAPHEPACRCPEPTQRRPRDVHPDGRGGVRGSIPT